MDQSIVGSVRRVVLALLVLALPNVAFFSIVLSPGTLQAATIAAASCSRADVGAAITAAQNGDTVLIPPGTCTWTGAGLGSVCQYSGYDHSFCLSSNTNDTKYITIQGAGIGQTVIIDQIPKTGQPDISVFRWQLNPGGLSRISGIEVRTGTGIGCRGGTPDISIVGTSTQFRLDNSKFVVRDNCQALTIAGYVRGVIDHNWFDDSLLGDCMILDHSQWGGFSSDFYGDHSWALPDTVGTAEAIFIEDNTFLNDQTRQNYQYCIDGAAGSRMVVRHNNFRGNTVLTNHGTDTSVRSMRQYEVYNNTWTGVDGVSPLDLQGSQGQAMMRSRGGVGIVFNNVITTVNGAPPTSSHDVVYLGVPADGRGRAGGYGFCNGSNPWDQNLSNTGNINNAGRRCLDQTGSGYGQLLNTAGGPVNTVTGTQPWPQQVAQPSYTWNNTCDGSPCGGRVNLLSGVSPITMGVDLIDGPRPGYTPFIYPHPLVSGTTKSAPPDAPSNLTVR